MNIYLIGMPGCGKSSVGQALALETKYNYIDLDHYIEKKNNMSIPEIFDKFGETRFRELEKAALNDFKDKDNYIISCGGGIIGNLDNKKLMYGKCVYIKVDINELKRRISNDKLNIRPMFKTKTVEELYKERKDKYAFFSDIDVDNKAIMECVNEIRRGLEIWKRY